MGADAGRGRPSAPACLRLGAVIIGGNGARPRSAILKVPGLPHRSKSMSISISLTVNGTVRRLELDDPRVTLLDLLRERLDLNGTKDECDRRELRASPD